jgi:hypothetical protein
MVWKKRKETTENMGKKESRCLRKRGKLFYRALKL